MKNVINNIIKGNKFIIAGIFILIVFVLFLLITTINYINEIGIENIFLSYGGFSRFIYFFVCFLQPIILPLPEPLTITAGATIFGALEGFVLGFSGTVLGIIIIFFVARLGKNNLIKKIVKKEALEKYEKLVEKNETIILILLYILPILPDEVISIGAGLSIIKFSKFIKIAIFSKVITVGTYSMSLDILSSLFKLPIYFQILIFLLIFLVYYFLRRYIEGRKIKS